MLFGNSLPGASSASYVGAGSVPTQIFASVFCGTSPLCKLGWGSYNYSRVGMDAFG